MKNLFLAGSADAASYPVQTRSARYAADRVTLTALRAIVVLPRVRRLTHRRR